MLRVTVVDIYEKISNILTFSIDSRSDTHYLTHPLIHLLTRLLTHSLTHLPTRLLKHLAHLHHHTQPRTHPSYVQHQGVVLGQVPSRTPLAAVHLVRGRVPVVPLKAEGRAVMTTGMQLLATCGDGMMHVMVCMSCEACRCVVE